MTDNGLASWLMPSAQIHIDGRQSSSSHNLIFGTPGGDQKQRNIRPGLGFDHARYQSSIDSNGMMSFI